MLIENRRDVMSRVAEKRRPAPPQVLVQLEPQEAFSRGISTYRSLDISAP